MAPRLAFRQWLAAGGAPGFPL